MYAHRTTVHCSITICGKEKFDTSRISYRPSTQHVIRFWWGARALNIYRSWRQFRIYMQHHGASAECSAIRLQRYANRFEKKFRSVKRVTNTSMSFEDSLSKAFGSELPNMLGNGSQCYDNYLLRRVSCLGYEIWGSPVLIHCIVVAT